MCKFNLFWVWKQLIDYADIRTPTLQFAHGQSLSMGQCQFPHKNGSMLSLFVFLLCKIQCRGQHFSNSQKVYLRSILAYAYDWIYIKIDKNVFLNYKNNFKCNNLPLGNSIEWLPYSWEGISANFDWKIN